MAANQTTQFPASERANELYWNSSQTVDDIVDQLEIGRNALYASIHPVPAGQSCPECAERMVYTNRTNRSRGTATCRACGTEAEVPGAEEAHREAAERTMPSESRSDALDQDDPVRTGWVRWRDDLAAVEPQRYALVGGAAALGVVVGAAATRALREMR